MKSFKKKKNERLMERGERERERERESSEASRSFNGEEMATMATMERRWGKEDNGHKNQMHHVGTKIFRFSCPRFGLAGFQQFCWNPDSKIRTGIGPVPKFEF